jgi:hypothetical protein
LSQIRRVAAFVGFLNNDSRPPSRCAFAQPLTVEEPEPTISETSTGVKPASKALTAWSFTSGGKNFLGL